MMHYTLQMMEKEEACKKRELRNLYEELAYMLCLSETHGAVKGEEYESEE